MQRSASYPQVSDEFFIDTPPSKSQSLGHRQEDAAESQHELPMYNPLSYAAKKESSRRRSAENAVHFIPVVLALCAVILWFFSNPESNQMVKLC